MQRQMFDFLTQDLEKYHRQFSNCSPAHGAALEVLVVLVTQRCLIQCRRRCHWLLRHEDRYLFCRTESIVVATVIVERVQRRCRFS